MAKTKEIITYLLLIIVFVLFVMIVEGKSTSINHVLKKLNLLPIRETFTELYFEDYSKLPKKTVAGESIKFSFLIHNLEGKRMTYPYSVYFEYPSGQKITIKNGEVTVDPDGLETVDIVYTFQNSNLYGKVYVKINNLNQVINFILPNYN